MCDFCKIDLKTMARYYESTTVFNFTWEQVVQGFWKRYPNPHSSHVLSEDTITREVRAGKLFTKRLLTKTNRVPKWGERLISKNTVKIVEESIVDPKEKVLITYTRNLGYVRIMSVIEKVVYKINADNPNTTVAVRSAWVDSQVIGLGRAIKAFGLDRLKKNCAKMVGGFNYVLNNMFPKAHQPNPNPSHSHSHAQTVSTASKLKDAAKSASDLAKAKATPIYASCQANQS